MKNILLNIFLINALFAFNQEIEYLDKDWEKCKKKQAVYYRETTLSPTGLYIIHDYYMSGQLQMSGSYSDKKLDIREGVFEYFNEKGDTTSVITYVNDEKHGQEKEFFENSQLESVTTYTKGKKTGKYYEFYEDGKLRGEADYVDKNIRGTAKKYYPSGKIGSELKLDEFGTGTYRTYFESGERFCDGFYRKGYASDNWNLYNIDGSINKIVYIDDADVHERLLYAAEIEQDKKRKEAFLRARFIDGAVNDFLSGREIPMVLPISMSDEIVEFPDVEAKFPGGPIALQQFIVDNVNYPTKAIKKNIESRSYISFVVEPDGKITNVKYELGHVYFEKESIRIIEVMPKWTSGEAKGKKVRTRCRLPINYTLTN